MKILAVGDIHLGAKPSRLPEELRGEIRELGPAAAWQLAVEEALRLRVDAVVLAGDVVDRSDDFFEGYRELLSGVNRLREAGMRVLAVAGNHDVRVLPRLADQVPGFELIGRGGAWECASLGSGSDQVHIWGWSFPSERVRDSPLAGVRFVRREGVNLGLLHCDLDQSGSPYAPVRRVELESAGLDGWLLGHIHKPSQLSADNLVGYLGSLTGTDPGEPGAHGPWLLTTSARGIGDFRQIVLAPLRWESADLDLTGVADVSETEARLVTRLRALHDSMLGSRAGAVGVRLRLVGRTGLGTLAAEHLREQVLGEVFAHDRVRYFIEKVSASTTPVVDVVELAKKNDPAGLLAANLLLLDRPPADPERMSFLARARRAVTEVDTRSDFAVLPGDPLTDDQLVELVRDSGHRILDELHAQVNGGDR